MFEDVNTALSGGFSKKKTFVALTRYKFSSYYQHTVHWWGFL